MNNKEIKTSRVVFVSIIVIITLLAVFAAGLSIYNILNTRKDNKNLVEYGEYIEFKGERINVLVEGDKKETVVLLPGYSTAAPAIDFKPLIEELRDEYRVVVIEPFGYGLSDITKRERNNKNIVEEIHYILDSLDIDRYILMAHSMSGIYSMDYIDKYADEIIGFVGIDTIMSHQEAVEKRPLKSYEFLRNIGFYRIMLNINPDMIISPSKDNNIIEQIRILTLRNTMNKNIINEGNNMKENMESVKDIVYPKDLPVLLLLSDKSVSEIDNWVDDHKKTIKNLDTGELKVLEGNHYLHHTRSKEIVESMDQIIK